jgi:peptide/nickel transport system substrate-binding protein
MSIFLRSRSPFTKCGRGSIAIHKLFALLLTLTFLITVNTAKAEQPSQLTIGVLGEPETFNPALNNTATSFFDYTSIGLTESDSKGETAPALAESWQISRNTITFKLRPNLKWSDGQALTTKDVDFSFNQVYLNPKIPNNYQDIFKIGKNQKFPKVKKIDDRQISFTTSEPFAPGLRTFGEASILPAHQLLPFVKRSQFLTAWNTQTKPEQLVSNGMYQLTEYVPGQKLVFDRNPYYWRKDAQGKQLPRIDRVIWQVKQNTDELHVLFQSGGSDIYSLNTASFAELKKTEAAGDFTIKNFGSTPGTSFLSFNLNQGIRNGKPLVDPVKSRWFNNLKFRQAVAHAIDRPQMINTVYNGLGALQNSPISVGSPYHLATGLKSYDYDLAKSKQLLQSAGFKYQGNDLYDSQNNPVSFNLITNSGNKTRAAMGAQIQQDLGKIGIKVNFQTVPFSLLVDKLDRSLDWEAHIIGFTGAIEPNDGFNFWSVDGRSHVFNQKPEPSEQRLIGRKVAPWEQQIHDLYVRGAQELNLAKRREIYAQTQRLTQENLPVIHLVNPVSLVAVRNKVQGFQPTQFGRWNLDEISISSAAPKAMIPLTTR